VRPPRLLLHLRRADLPPPRSQRLGQRLSSPAASRAARDLSRRPSRRRSSCARPSGPSPSPTRSSRAALSRLIPPACPSLAPAPATRRGSRARRIQAGTRRRGAAARRGRRTDPRTITLSRPRTLPRLNIAAMRTRRRRSRTTSGCRDRPLRRRRRRHRAALGPLLSLPHDPLLATTRSCLPLAPPDDPHLFPVVVAHEIPPFRLAGRGPRTSLSLPLIIIATSPVLHLHGRLIASLQRTSRLDSCERGEASERTSQFWLRDRSALIAVAISKSGERRARRLALVRSRLRCSRPAPVLLFDLLDCLYTATASSRAAAPSP